MNKKAFIFDLDGVIVDTAKFHFLAWKKLADSLNINFTHEINEQLKGVSRVRSLEIILSQGNVQASQEDKNIWLVQKNEDYLAFVHKMDKSEILPRVEELLQFLKTTNQYVVLGSASKNARPILEKENILHYFDALVDEIKQIIDEYDSIKQVKKLKRFKLNNMELMILIVGLYQQLLDGKNSIDIERITRSLNISLSL
jgi:beta-phosphoglucomutase